MRGFLSGIVEAKRAEVDARMRARPLRRLLGEEAPPARDFAAALASPGISAIAEIKRRSPSKGVLREDLRVEALAARYAESGARALSILTDREFFGGSDEDLIAARGATELPVLRKDFTIDPYQIHEARRLGADAVLLIVRILGPGQLRELSAVAREVGLAAVVEVHTEAELDRANKAGAAIIGINSRDLDTFETDLSGAMRLRESIPPDRIAVAESGIRTREDVRRVERQGFDAMLVGESLLRADEPGSKLAELLGHDHD